MSKKFNLADLGTELDQNGEATNVDDSDSTGKRGGGGVVSTPPASKEKKKILFKKVC